ncbi:fumarylacetoacetate hydrolase family protein [Luminiphilus sp.]|nr:fumarylacetoacetate hydrolase family protein [Luminiphilus sp.]
MRTVLFNDQPYSPNKIVCIGKNYTDHIEEMDAVVPDDMVVFMKPNSAISQTLRAFDGEPIHFEGEICFAMIAGQVAGIGFGLDLTKRALQWTLKKAGLPWERAKAFDGSALFSDFVPAPANLDNVRLELWIDGALRQQGGCKHMLYPPTSMLGELANFTTLDDYDIVMTGTPAGVGEVPQGAQFEGRVFDGDRELIRAIWQAQ